MSSCLFFSAIFSLIISQDVKLPILFSNNYIEKTKPEEETTGQANEVKLIFDDFIDLFSNHIPLLIDSLDQDIVHKSLNCFHLPNNFFL